MKAHMATEEWICKAGEAIILLTVEDWILTW